MCSPGVAFHTHDELSEHRADSARFVEQILFIVGQEMASAGDEVILFGPGDAGEPTAQEWADTLGTISYDIVTRIGNRVPRVYS